MDKYNLPKYAIQAVLEAPYKFMIKKMREQKYLNFYHQHLGRFVVKDGIKRRALATWDIRQENKAKKKELYRLLHLAVQDKKDELNRQNGGDELENS